MIRRIDYRQRDALIDVQSESCAAITISTAFDPGQKQGYASQAFQLDESSRQLLQECGRTLRFGGLLYVYGLPRELAVWAEKLAGLRDETWRMIFKYWLALDLDDAPPGQFLKASHLGLLLFHKSRAGKKTLTPFTLNTDPVRTPHLFCPACKNTLKDWGGKKHLMNPLGAALPDVWRDLPRRPIVDSVIPDDVLKRVQLLSGAGEMLHIVHEGSRRREEADTKAVAPFRLLASSATSDGQWRMLKKLKLDEVYAGDCVSFLHRVKVLHPEGIFDLAFADPPYNLEKKYECYADALAERHYLEWCHAWLDGMAENLKPGGSLFVLNLPKWAVHHATFLNSRLEFRHWIVWDALSDPRGKLMPAHYALLWYTKPGGRPVFNYSPLGAKPIGDFVLPPDSPKYCLRARCIKERKAAGDDEKTELSDVWFDIHRIKHKRDRDAHPCQLPEKLMERIIRLTTRPGDLVFDPFCGAGTTAIAARKLGRKFVVTDVDEKYVCITHEKLAAMNKNAGESGDFAVPRESIIRPRGAGSKKGIEVYLQQLAGRLGRVPTESDVQADRPEILRQIDLTYSTRSAAFKRARIGLGQAT